MSDSRYSKKYGIVILLDALGMKGIWRVKDPYDVLSRWDGLVGTLAIDIKDSKKRKIDFNYYAFSDTLIITLSGGSDEDLVHQAGMTLSSFVTYGIEHEINFRGCLSIGRFFQSEKMVLGPAIDEAALNYEKADWVGVFATPSMYSILTKLALDKKIEPIILYLKYPVPTKQGTLDTWAINLLRRITNAELKKKHKNLINLVHYKLQNSEDPIAADKWKNTLDFLYFANKVLPDPKMDE